MTLQTIPVKVGKGIVRSMDGTPLPEHANALLVIMPAATEADPLEEWQRPFDAFFETVRRHPTSQNLDSVSDIE